MCAWMCLAKYDHVHFLNLLFYHYHAYIMRVLQNYLKPCHILPVTFFELIVLNVLCSMREKQKSKFLDNSQYLLLSKDIPYGQNYWQ